MRKNFSWFATVILSLTLFPAAFVSADSGDVIGWIEKGKIMPWGITVKLKMDTGALTSSMHAEKIEFFDKGDEEWARFELELEDQKTGQVVRETVERKVLRKVKLRGAGGVDRRASVLMQLCVGDTIYEEQFTLKDRDRFNYPVLIGRRTIEHLGYIDAARTFTMTPTCDKDSKLLDHKALKEQSEVGL